MARPVVTWVDRGQSERGPACESTHSTSPRRARPRAQLRPMFTSTWAEGRQAVHRRPRPVCLTSTTLAAEVR
jgi:hypothetical protein